MESKIILITGATSGFGYATAQKFAANGWKLILTGRRLERLKELQQELQKKHGTQSLLLNYDIRDRQANHQMVSNIPDEWKVIDVLVNNAGLAAGRAHFDQSLIDDWDTMIDTNLKGLLYISKEVLPFMIKKGKGHIINIGSVAAKDIYESGNVYCATKHAVDAISRAMRIDLLSHRIKVTAIHPGAADTEFSTVRFKGDKKEADAVYQGYTPLTAEDIADIIYYTATLPPHVCINDLVVTPLAQADAFYFFKDGK